MQIWKRLIHCDSLRRTTNREGTQVAKAETSVKKQCDGFMDSREETFEMSFFAFVLLTFSLPLVGDLIDWQWVLVQPYLRTEWS